MYSNAYSEYLAKTFDSDFELIQCVKFETFLDVP